MRRGIDTANPDIPSLWMDYNSATISLRTLCLRTEKLLIITAIAHPSVRPSARFL